MPQTAHRPADEPNLAEEQKFVATFRACNCSDKPHGYLWGKKGSSDEEKLPVMVPSITAGEHLLNVNVKSGQIQPEDLPRLMQEIRDAGLPELAVSPQTDIDLIEHQLEELRSPMGQLMQMLEEALGGRVTVIGTGPDFDPSRLIDEL